MDALLEEVRSVLIEMDIEDQADLDSALRDDLGMDSREMVHLLATLERRLGLTIPERSTRMPGLRDVRDVLNLLIEAESSQAGIYTIDDAPTLAHRCRSSQVIQAPPEMVYRALHEVQAWPIHLPHVLEIVIRHDDGQYQEFVMAVDSPKGQLRVRSVRNCVPGLIEWFQPEPPDFLLHHGGTWRFHARPDGTTELEATHAWNLDKDEATRLFPAETGKDTAEQVHELLLEHSRLAIETWRTVLEGAALQSAGAATGAEGQVRA